MSAAKTGAFGNRLSEIGAKPKKDRWEELPEDESYDDFLDEVNDSEVSASLKTPAEDTSVKAEPKRTEEKNTKRGKRTKRPKSTKSTKSTKSNVQLKTKKPSPFASETKTYRRTQCSLYIRKLHIDRLEALSSSSEFTKGEVLDEILEMFFEEHPEYDILLIENMDDYYTTI